jgi:4-hydroxybenzoate polyprenyltransferase/phosphoglycolate phosphatase-like HAD superfamily hydrolase
MAGDIGEFAGVGDIARSIGDIAVDARRDGVEALGIDPRPRRDAPDELPLCVDLDGTLVRTDTLHEQYLSAFVRHPLAALLLVAQLVRGKAAFKRALSRLCPLSPESLPYQADLLEFLRHEKARGRKLVLATASDREVAESIAAHLDIFDEVIGSDGATNLKGRAKAAHLAARFGRGKFSYAGNSRADLQVWSEAGEVILVNTPRSIDAELARAPAVAHRFGSARTPRKSKLKLLIRAMRVYQWVKNVLVFIPMLLAHVSGLEIMVAAISMFFAFSMTASGIYIINDLLDLAADRAHPRKRARPFASGDLQLDYGALGPLLLTLGLAFAWVGISFYAFLLLLFYVVVTTAYSAYLKTKPLVDVFTLAGLYTVRMLAGGVATRIHVSIWLLGFSLFVFLSLAFLKRASELTVATAEGRRPSSRRAYRPDDEGLLRSMGITSAFTAALALSLYLSSDVARQHYLVPSWLWLVVPLVLFAQCRLWLSGTRGYMTDDPIVYACKDWVCWIVFACVAIVLVLAMRGPDLSFL